MMDGFEVFKSAIIRIFHRNGTVVGAGFLVNEKHCITCAHVVRQALNYLEGNDILQELIDLDFPQVNLEREKKREPKITLKAKVVIWRPYRSDLIGEAKVGEDIAVLKIEGELPSEIKPIELIIAEKPWDHSFRIHGFPEGHDCGIWTEGKLKESQGNGWIQMRPEERSIEQGFSGAPVWDEQQKGVIGMAVASEDKSVGVMSAFAIPTEILVNFALKELELLEILLPLEEHYFRLLEEAYLACRPHWERTPASNLREILAEFFEYIPEKLADFVAELIVKENLPKNKKERDKLKKWGEKQAKDFTEILSNIENKVKNNEEANECLTYLLLRVQESKLCKENYILSAVFIPNRKVYELTGKGSYTLETRIGEKETLTLKEIDELIPRLLEDYLRQSNQYKIEKFGSTTIIFFLPCELFNQSFIVCEVQDEDELPIPLAAEYQVLIRSEKRLQITYKHQDIWIDKWNFLKRILKNVCWKNFGSDCDCNHWRQVFAKLNQVEAIGLSFTQIPSVDMFKVLDRTGTPVAIWARHHPEAINCQQEFQNLLNCSIGQLPERVKQKHLDALEEYPDKPEQHFGHHLTLLWEDPTLLPPHIDYVTP
jgi:DNA-binding PadR family transcriptional regulator